MTLHKYCGSITHSLTWLSSPTKKSIRKKSMAQKGEIGSWATAEG